MTEDPRLFIYITDPMCSWCYAFGPELDQLSTKFGWGVEILVGGLRPGPGGATPLNQSLRTALESEWRRISAQTGMPFDYSNLERENWIYDTELPARAVVVLRDRHPELAHVWVRCLQHAFYAQAIDITNFDEYRGLITELPVVDADWFLGELRSEESRKLAWKDFSLSRNMGVTGYPTLLLSEDQRTVELTFGYRTAAEITSLVESAVAGR